MSYNLKVPYTKRSLHEALLIHNASYVAKQLPSRRRESHYDVWSGKRPTRGQRAAPSGLSDTLKSSGLSREGDGRPPKLFSVRIFPGEGLRQK